MIKKYKWLIGALVIALLALGVYGTTTVFADDSTPQVPFGGRGPGGPGGPHGHRGLSDAELEAAAGVLNMSTDDLSAALQSGQTLKELADTAAVDIQAVQDALRAVRQTELRDHINQAVTDGTLSQEKADWLLEGLDKGFLEGPGFGFGRGFGDHLGKGAPTATAAPSE